MTRPSVLVLMCDQMQAKRMGFVDGVAHTPHLDALAAEGVHFPNAITVHGQCVPSRCAFATGMSPHECNVMANFGFSGHCGHLTKNNRTFFQEFQDNGYLTAHFGKSHLGSPLRMMGFDVGERLDGHFPEGKEPPERVKLREEIEAVGADKLLMSSGSHYSYLGDALKWLNNYEPSEKPLFFMFDTNLPHPPFRWEEQWQDLFKPEDMVLPRSYYEETFDSKPSFVKDRATKGSHPIESEEQLRTETAQYYTLIATVDKACGQIIDQFKKKGMWDNTIVLFFTDHGDMMGAHKLRRKGCYPYEEIYNIPCIMKLPVGMERKRSVMEEVIISTDLPGALLELAGIEPSPQFANSGVMRALQREAPTGDECVFFEHYVAWWGQHPFYGIRTSSMKYVRYYGRDDTEEMYDLSADPDELHNVVADGRYAAQYSELSARADEWWSSTNGRTEEYYESPEFKNNINY